MKNVLIIAGGILAILAGFTVFFAFQTTPGNVLNSVRADGLKEVGGVITVPEKYTVIDVEAFAGKGEFSKIVIEGEAEIKSRAFYGCQNLSEVTLNKECDIGEEAFASCPFLKTVIVNSADGACADNAFDGHGGLTIYCHEGSQVIDVAKLNDISYKLIED